MLIVISPSKTLDFSGATATPYSVPEFLDESQQLIEILRGKSAAEIADLMALSPKLGALNWQRYQDFTLPFTTLNARQAIYAFKGDVYEGLAASSLSTGDVEFANTRLRIISGLYGLLRPLDLIMPYRLEMGTKLANQNGRDLYKFWGDKITEKLNAARRQTGSDALVNLASEEYFKAVNKKLLEGRIITPVFKEKKGAGYKIISFYAKAARGMMASYIIKNRITKIAGIKDFNASGYQYSAALSEADNLVFVR